ncbi:nucleoside triphosphate pyrophosphohydrolase [bacterium]|nr:nucleoside triphosphate pyrophosphohydrolase [bacterium]
MKKDKICKETIALINIIEKLLGPNGCPWDKKQNTKTMIKHLIEEMYEFIDGIENEDPNEMQEEMGDLFFLMFFLGKLIEKEYGSEFHTSIRYIKEKLIRRHPHVFGDVKVNGEDDVLKNWEKIKGSEKEGKLILSGVPKHLPALLKAYRIQEKVSRVGFDWTVKEGIIEKLDEELTEFKDAIKKDDKPNINEEFGDLLFTIVNIGRHMNIDAENVLQNTNEKFLKRFNKLEKLVKNDKKKIDKLTLSELNEYWAKVKKD